MLCCSCVVCLFILKDFAMTHLSAFERSACTAACNSLACSNKWLSKFATCMSNKQEVIAVLQCRGELDQLLSYSHTNKKHKHNRTHSPSPSAHAPLLPTQPPSLRVQAALLVGPPHVHAACQALVGGLTAGQLHVSVYVYTFEGCHSESHTMQSIWAT